MALSSSSALSRTQIERAAVQLAEDAEADSGDEDDPELLQARVVVESPGQHLLGSDEHAQRLGEQGDARQEFNFHDTGGRLPGINKVENSRPAH